MIPMLAIVAVRARPKPSPRVWIPVPLFLLWLVLLPIVVIAIPIVLIVSWFSEVDGLAALSITWQILCGLRNTTIEVDHRQASIHIRIH